MVVLGVSLDSQEDNRTFRQKQQFPFPLLCDTDRSISIAYGAAGFERAFLARRITYVIDEDGKILHSFDKVIPANHAEDLLKML